MSAGPITVKQKTDVSIKLHFTNSDGSDTDITGWTVRFTAKKNLKDAALLFPQKVVTVHSDPTHGATYVPLTDADLDVAADSYYYGIHPVDGSGNDRDSGVGMFIVQPTTEGA